ncbi:PAS domain-containing protein [Desulfovibrio subterraneus]|uniref:PAS domain-containing protein n=1 Tax=Desulfovibrio subterraneus TaxID=2718620 RepID=A0A7J0BMN5_9BACT|nr:PAS domain-containing protein [Desulfovibrio subterraneus]GFM34481.1 hypothetical protein DSM101010T_28460 [Desulfovibrio subterraneus]
MTFKELRARQDVPVIVVDGEGMVLEINEAFSETYGWSVSDLVGKMLSRIIPSQLRDAHHMGFARHQMTGARTVLGMAVDLSILLPDGCEVVAIHYIVDGEEDGHKCYAATIVPRAEG